MKKLFFILLLLMVLTNVKAQIGVSAIGTSVIGVSTIGQAAIGKAFTPSCNLPGICGTGCPVYTFTGSGNWSIAGNWKDNIVPPTTLSGCTQIIINPTGNNECVLDIPLQIIPYGTSITVMNGKKFRIPGKLQQK